jgi:LacI family transcriptional regulator
MKSTDGKSQPRAKSARSSEKEARRVTLQDVASFVGVSIPTVSKVLNKSQEVNEETRERVTQALETLGYYRRVNTAATRTGLLEFVITELDTAWATTLLQGADAEANKNGYSLILTVTHDRDDKQRDWIKSLSERATDGIVLVVTSPKQLPKNWSKSLSTPVVIIDEMGAYDNDTPSVGATNWIGGFTATKHLIDLGHKRIGMVTCPQVSRLNEERYAGYREALNKAGIEFDPTIVSEEENSPSGGQKGARKLLKAKNAPTAIFAGSDEQAFGVYEEAFINEIRIPQDLSVVGFDDVHTSQWTTPPLTTVQNPIHQMAAIAVRTVLDIREGKNDVSSRVEISTKLIVRSSTSVPKGLKAKK